MALSIINMTNYERNIIFSIAAGLPENFPLIYQLHDGFKRGFELLETCARHGIRGNSFKQMWLDHNGSKVRVGSYLLKKLNQDLNRKIQYKDLA